MVTNIVITNDGKSLISASVDGTVKVRCLVLFELLLILVSKSWRILGMGFEHKDRAAHILPWSEETRKVHDRRIRIRIRIRMF
jgi:hypothetical protein